MSGVLIGSVIDGSPPFAFEARSNAPFQAPQAGQANRRIFALTRRNAAELPCQPDRKARFTPMVRCIDSGPIGRGFPDVSIGTFVTVSFQAR